MAKQMTTRRRPAASEAVTVPRREVSLPLFAAQCYTLARRLDDIGREYDEMRRSGVATARNRERLGRALSDLENVVGEIMCIVADTALGD